MDPTWIAEEARLKGLRDPRVLPYRKRTGEAGYKLYFGPLGKRRDLLVPATATHEDVTALIEKAKLSP